MFWIQWIGVINSNCCNRKLKLTKIPRIQQVLVWVLHQQRKQGKRNSMKYKGINGCLDPEWQNMFLASTIEKMCWYMPKWRKNTQMNKMSSFTQFQSAAKQFVMKTTIDFIICNQVKWKVVLALPIRWSINLKPNFSAGWPFRRKTFCWIIIAQIWNSISMTSTLSFLIKAKFNFLIVRTTCWISKIEISLMSISRLTQRIWKRCTSNI